MQNELVHSAQIEPREIGIVTQEIKELRRQANSMALVYAIEIGRRLVEAKAVLPHGQWGEWLKNEVDFSQRTASNMIKLYEEYGDQQLTLFGVMSNSQAIANLPTTHALMLLAVPAEEREAFAEEVHAEDLSTRELQAAIRERKEAQDAADAANDRAEQLEQALLKSEAARRTAEEAAAEVTEWQDRVKELEEKLSASDEKLAKSKAKLKEAKEHPKLPPDQLDKIREEALLEATKKAKEDIAAELEATKKEAAEAVARYQKAQEVAENAEKRLEAAQAALKTANPEVASFKALFDEMQTIAATLQRKIHDIDVGGDADTADKLRRALQAFGTSIARMDSCV